MSCKQSKIIQISFFLLIFIVLQALDEFQNSILKDTLGTIDLTSARIPKEKIEILEGLNKMAVSMALDGKMFKIV